MEPGAHWEESLPRFSLGRRIAVFVLVATTIVIGLIAASGIPLELFPAGYSAPFLAVDAPWRDAPPREVLEKVVLPLEEELSTVAGLERLSSSARTGFSRSSMSFKQGTDMDVAYREVRDRIERARARLPSDLEQIFVRKHDGSGIPVMLVGVAVDPGVTDSYDLIQKAIVLPLSRVDGVASVQSDGLQQKEVIIDLDRERTEAAGLNIYVLGQQLASDNFALASGTVRHGGKKLLLRSVSTYASLEELRERWVSPTTRLGDIADIRYALPDQLWRVRVNSKPALALQVHKEGQANTVEVSRRLAEAFAAIQANPRLQGFELAILFSQGDVILESLDTLLSSGRIGAIFAVLVLLFFLRRFRLTLIITLSIPLSLMIALVVMYFADESLNVLSLLGLMICVGLLVDNSVVVAENIHRLYAAGSNRRDACIRGAAEIALAIVLATLTTVVVFLPVSLVEGKAQFFLMRLAFPICVSLLASLVVALIVVPLCVYLTLGRGREEDGAGDRQGKAGERAAVRRVHTLMDRTLGWVYRYTFDLLNDLYVRGLRFFLHRRLDVVLVLVVGFAVTSAGPCTEVDIVPISQEDRRSFEVMVDLPDDYSLSEAEAFFAVVEKKLEELRQEIGLRGYFIVHMASWGKIDGWLPPNPDFSRREALERALEVLPEKPGVKYFSGSESDQEEEDQQSIFSIVLEGDDPDMVEEAGRNVRDVLVRVDGVLGAKRTSARAPNELGLVVDRDRAQRQGINPQVIAGVVAYALRGQPLRRFYWDGVEIPVRARYQEEDRDELEELEELGVPTAQGGMVPISSVTDVQYLAAARQILRRNKRIAHTVVLDLEEGKEEETRRKLAGLIGALELPEGVTMGQATASRSQDEEDIAAMKFAIAVSVVFIYLLMGFLFESFVLPLSILFTIPLASFGVYWAHYFVGRDLDFLGVVGVVLLIGVVVNNGIVLIDYVNRLRESGRQRDEALLVAARRRFRPILMTAATTICGMVPVTLGAPTSIGLSYKSFGLALIGGLATSTILTLLVVPVFYTIFDDARVISGRAMRWALGRRSVASDTSAGAA